MDFCDKYHRKGNSVILVNDDLTQWIKQDFPDYRLDASVIKNINNQRKLDKAFEIYDEVVLPMELNDDIEFLDNIEEKRRITLFANAGCAYTCPSHTFYNSFSKMNKDEKGAKYKCSQTIKERQNLGIIYFDLDMFIEMGFHSFKLLRPRPDGFTAF